MPQPVEFGVGSGNGVLVELSPFSLFFKLYPATSALTEKLKVSLFVAKNMCHYQNV